MRILLVSTVALALVAPPLRQSALAPRGLAEIDPATLPAFGADDGKLLCSVKILRERHDHRYTVDDIRAMVAEADVIVRAVAVDSARAEGPPELGLPFRITGHRIDFRTQEILAGPWPDTVFTLPGNVVDQDNFNTLAVPYGIMRESDRPGPCYALEYRIGGEYLFLLEPETRAHPGSAMTARWMPLGPTNEQIRGADDPWVRWVRDQLPAR